MDLGDIISIVITRQTRTPAQAGFGIPLIVSHSAAWAERVREYTSFTALAADFPTTTSPEYLAGLKAFAQNPRPKKVLVGRANDFKPTQQFEFTPAVLANYRYSFFANGVEVVYTSDGTPLASEITAGLKAAFDALALAFTSSQQSANAVLRLAGNAPGNWIDVKSIDPNLPVVQNQVDPGIATSLAAIRAENKTWYGLATLFNSKAIIDATAAWAEANGVLYVAQTQDSVVRDTPKSGTDDVGESTQAAGLDRTSVWYSPSTGDFIGVALLCAVLPLDPGSETWAFKALKSVTTAVLTETQIAHLEAKNVGFYNDTAGLSITWEGKVASGEYIDVIRFTDWLTARVAEEVFRILANAKKIPFTRKGIATIGGGVRRVLKQAANPPFEGITPDYTVTLPDIADVPDSDKVLRTLNGLAFAGTLTGAIHKANFEGTVSV